MNKKIKASHTLESSIVITVIMFVIISLMYLTFYMHDRVVLKLCAYSSAIDSVFEDKECYRVATDNVQKLNTFTIGTYVVAVQNNTVEYRGNMESPFTMVSMFFNGEEIKESGSARGKINIEKMYVLKIVEDKLKEEGSR